MQAIPNLFDAQNHLRIFDFDEEKKCNSHAFISRHRKIVSMPIVHESATMKGTRLLSQLRHTSAIMRPYT
jgi:hypothetical protein